MVMDMAFTKVMAARDDGTAGSGDARLLSGKGGYSSAPLLAGGYVQ
jgi:hypothetical protein